jgi:hypothetical protein
MFHKDFFGTNHVFPLACYPPAEFSVLAVHEKRFVEKPSVIDQLFAKQKAAAGEVVKAKPSRF